MKEKLLKWENATKELADLFVLHYFGKDAESYWIADDPSGVLYVNDFFFNLSDIVGFIKYRYSKAKMFEYYGYALQCYSDKEIPINIKSYRHLKLK